MSTSHTGPRRTSLLSVSLAALALSSLWITNASAQASGDREAPAEPAADGARGDEAIIVTGSRLARSTFDTPSPVTVLGDADFRQLQLTNVGEGVAELPAFRPSTNPSTNGFGSFNVGAQIVNLRGLGVTRNLVLVDGRRFAPTTREGSVDLNFIPSTLVSRVEVVTGGASAAYGSDALAGVVNVILDTEFEGFEAQLDQGISGEGDGRNLHAGIGYGTAFAGGAGHFVIGGEYSDQEKVGNCFTRDWCEVGAVVTNPGFAVSAAAPNGNGLPQYVRSDDNAGWFMNPSGVVSRVNNATGIGNVIANSRGTGAITFAPNGAVLSSQAGTPASGLSQVGGDLYATYTDVDLVAPVERYTAFAHAGYDFSDSFRGFLEGSYGHVDGGTYQAAYFSSTIPIFADNPYIPAAIRAVAGFPAPAQPTAPASLVRPATATFNLGRVFDDLARGFSRSKADTYRVTTGLSGEFSDTLEWDAYYQYGRTDRLQTVDNNLVVGDPAFSVSNPATIANSHALFLFAADAVVNPATGTPTCRALLSTDPALRAAAAGCVPINLFGTGNVTQAGKDYIYEQLREDITLDRHVVAANLRGSTGDLLAGPLSFAIGAEYRVDSIDVRHDDLSNLYAYFQNFGSDYNGETEVIEGYLEAELPILRDLPGAQSLSLNGAIRQTHYNVSGFGSYLRTNVSNEFNATTWKVGLNWEPVSWLRLRATQSRDIRAPNFAELFLASASSFAPVTNPFVLTSAGARTTNFPTTVSGGSPDLRPEKADTTTVGLVFQGDSGMLDGLRLSVDGYRIEVKDYISTAPGGGQFLIDRCFAGETAACAYFDRNATTGAITTVRNVSLNLDRILAKGIDFEADYRIPLSDENTLQLRGIATYVDTLKSESFGDVVDRAGQTGNTVGLAAPQWILNGTAAFLAPQWSVTLQGRFIDSGLYDAQRIGPDDDRFATTLPNSISDNHVSSRFYVNLFASVFVDEEKRYELFGSVSNLFDTSPPAAPETQFYTNPVYFDTLGRYFRVGGRVRL
ncbi:MAG TPA: TonB-dependent receptor [Croceibacterium sp.]|nr:TonB-dependent receptor [Croceibacterium sp.]